LASMRASLGSGIPIIAYGEAGGQWVVFGAVWHNPAISTKLSGKPGLAQPDPVT